MGLLDIDANIVSTAKEIMELYPDSLKAYIKDNKPLVRKSYCWLVQLKCETISNVWDIEINYLSYLSNCFVLWFYLVVPVLKTMRALILRVV